MPVLKNTPRNLKPKSTLLLSDSKLRNILLKSIRQTGRKAIFSHPVWPSAVQEKYQGIKLGRRLNQASASRALDILEVKDKQQRATIHKLAQEFINKKESNTSKKSVSTKTFIKNIIKTLGKQKGQEFLYLLDVGLSENAWKLNLKPLI